MYSHTPFLTLMPTVQPILNISIVDQSCIFRCLERAETNTRERCFITKLFSQHLGNVSLNMETMGPWHPVYIMQQIEHVQVRPGKKCDMQEYYTIAVSTEQSAGGSTRLPLQCFSYVVLDAYQNLGRKKSYRLTCHKVSRRPGQETPHCSCPRLVYNHRNSARLFEG